MGNNAAQSLGSQGRQDVMKFMPQDLTIVVGDHVSPDVEKLAKAGFLTLLRKADHFLFDQRAGLPVDEQLTISIDPENEGQIQPTRFMRDGERKLVVVGRQRVKAIALRNYRITKQAEAAGKKPAAIDALLQRVTGIVLRAEEADAYKIVLAENEVRVDDPPIMRAQKMQRAMDLGLSEDVVARIFRLDVATLKLKVRMLDMAPEVRAAVDSRELAESTAYLQLTSLNREEQVSALKEMREAGAMKGEAAKVALETIKKGGKPARVVEGDITRAPSKKILRRWVDSLEPPAKGDEFAAGVRTGIQLALGLKPRGSNQVKKYLE